MAKTTVTIENGRVEVHTDAVVGCTPCPAPEPCPTPVPPDIVGMFATLKQGQDEINHKLDVIGRKVEAIHRHLFRVPAIATVHYGAPVKE